MNIRQTPAEAPAGVLSCLQEETRRHLEGRRPDAVILTHQQPPPAQDAFDQDTLRSLEDGETVTIICRRDDVKEALEDRGIPQPDGLDDIPEQGLVIIERGQGITVADVSEHRSDVRAGATEA